MKTDTVVSQSPVPAEPGLTCAMYEHDAVRTLYPGLSHERATTIYLLGLMGEIGEVCDLVKKVVVHGYTLEQKRDELRSELGDCYWYAVALVHMFGLTFADVAMLGGSESVLVIQEFSPWPLTDPSTAESQTLEDTALRAASETAKLFDRINTLARGTQSFKAFGIGSLKVDLFEVVYRLAALCTACGLTLDDVLRGNMLKRMARYPAGFQPRVEG